MGYYSGNGVVFGGSSTGSGGGFSLPVSGGAQINRITTRKTTKFPGVDYDTVKDKTASRNMSAGYAVEYKTLPGGGYEYYNDCLVPDYSGTCTDYQWQQIGDSNLYELIIFETTVTSTVNTSVIRI